MIHLQYMQYLHDIFGGSVLFAKIAVLLRICVSIPNYILQCIYAQYQITDNSQIIDHKHTTVCITTYTFSSSLYYVSCADYQVHIFVSIKALCINCLRNKFNPRQFVILPVPYRVWKILSDRLIS